MNQERLYRALLRLYPPAFRARFGDDMVQLFSDQLRDTRTGRAPAAIGRVWLRTLHDLVVTVLIERLHGDRSLAHSLTVAPTAFTRMLGSLGIAGGLGLVAVFVVEIGPQLNFLRLLLFNVGAIAIAAAVNGSQAAVSRKLSLAVAVPAVLANAWYLGMVILSIGRPVFPEPDPTFRPTFFYAGVTLWLADAAFGAVALRIGAVSRWGALSLTIGSLLAVTGVGGLGFTTGPLAAIIGPLALVGIGLVGVGWILLGLDVAMRRRPVTVR